MSQQKEVRFYYYPADYEAADESFLRRADAVVIDVLRATSTMLTALSHGIRRVQTSRTIDEAFEFKKARPAALLVGERGGWKVEGFDRGNSPREFVSIPSGVDELIMTTTNGTRALKAAAPAARIIIGCFLNLSSVCAALQESNRPLALFCAGTEDDFSLEDALFAGAILDRLDLNHPGRSIWTASQRPLLDRLSEARNGHRLLGIPTLRDDVAWCAQVDAFPLLPVANNRGLVSVS